ncbi:MAG TPA: DUF2062 domain-containing protein [Alphaproteobacteria bacterium]|nr:DUF2062 domain-containing protein [Alphaproteobacteria bacterium]
MSYLKRQYFRRFLRPINKMKLGPGQVGRTVVVGLFWGLTASVGLQVVGVGLCWLAMRGLDRPFNLPIALLLTGVTNPLTIAPIYSLYFVVGCAALPSCHPGAGSVETIIVRLKEEGLWDVLADSWQFFAITYAGSLPFAIAGSVAGFYFGRWVGGMLQHRRRRRAETLARQRAERHGLAARG